MEIMVRSKNGVPNSATDLFIVDSMVSRPFTKPVQCLR